MSGGQVALLRGINVGGKNKLPMDVLERLFGAAGCTGVVTYIQSGNVVFSPPAKSAEVLAAELSQAIAKKLKLTVPVVLRSAAELGAVLSGNPFVADGKDEAWLHVMFLAQRPPPAAVASLEPDRSPPDTFQVRGREIYLCCPNGVGKSRLTNAWFDARLKTVSTARNWRTVQKLVELAT